MSLSRRNTPVRTEPTLHELHEGANAAGARALDIFRTVTEDLTHAASIHDEVQAKAQVEIDNYTALRDAAQAASLDKARQAAAIAQLVS